MGPKKTKAGGMGEAAAKKKRRSSRAGSRALVLVVLSAVVVVAAGVVFEVVRRRRSGAAEEAELMFAAGAAQLRAYEAGAEGNGALCGVVTASVADVRAGVAGALLEAAAARVLVAAPMSGAAEEGVHLSMSAGGRVRLSAPLETVERTVDRALLALDLECPSFEAGGRKRPFSRGSPRLEALRGVVAAIDGYEGGGLEPIPDAAVALFRESMLEGGLDVDTRGLWLEDQQGGLVVGAAALETADTPLMRVARACDARATRALVALGADAAETYDGKKKRPVDLAIACNARSVFATVRELAVGCGAPCLRFGSRTPSDGLAPVHRVLLRWSSSFFHTRPEPNPWNMLLQVMVQSGADMREATRQPARETALHIAAAKRNVEAAALLLASQADDPQGLAAMVRARDFTGSTPLAVAFSWKLWAVTIPRLLAAAAAVVDDADKADAALKTQALDGVAGPCIAAMPGYDPDRAGFTLRGTADALAHCGFLYDLPLLLLDHGAPLDARDDFGKTPLHAAHPALVDDALFDDGTFDAPTEALDRIRRAIAGANATAPVVQESRADREAWHLTPTPTSSFQGRLDDSTSSECDVETIRAEKGLDIASLLDHPSLKEAHKPLLILDALDASIWDRPRRHWADRATLLATHGGALVRPGPIPYASAFAVREDLVSVREALERAAAESARAASLSEADRYAPSYVFEQIRWPPQVEAEQKKTPTPSSHSLEDLVFGADFGALRPLLANATREFQGGTFVFHNAQFYVGDRLSGAPVHYHSHAVNFLVHGRKRWLLFAPGDAVYSKKPAANIDLAKLRAARVPFATCVQPAGSLIYVPAGWGHAVLNLDDNTVGAALEFHTEGELTWSHEIRASDQVSATRRL